MTATPSVNVELVFDLDIELFKRTIYAKKWPPISLLQKTFKIGGLPKCLISKWSWEHEKGHRRLGVVPAPHPFGAVNNIAKANTMPAPHPFDPVNDFAVGNSLEPSPSASLPPTNRFAIASTVRDPNMDDIRTYLQNRGAGTPCSKDCSGRGFCLNTIFLGTNTTKDADFKCVCQSSWTGDDCTIPLITVVDGPGLQGHEEGLDGIGGVTAVEGGLHPRPAKCGHGVTVSVDDEEYKALRVCQGRTNPLICASGNMTEMRILDDTISKVLRGYTETGYPCASAMAELQCRMSFPAVIDPQQLTIAPVSFTSCVDLFEPCMGETTATTLCSAASGDSAAQEYAGVAAPNSPWNTTELPSLFTAETEANTQHRQCVSTEGFHLIGCPAATGRMVHINTDVWESVDQIDAYVFRQINGTDSQCNKATRIRLCQEAMPICNVFGNPIKIPFEECTNMVSLCPDLSDKEPGDYGLDDNVDFGTQNLVDYSEAVCSDESDFFTRNFVGKHPVLCGLEPFMATEAPPTQPTSAVAIIAVVAVLVGIVVGTVVALVVVKKIATTRSGDTPDELLKYVQQAGSQSSKASMHRIHSIPMIRQPPKYLLGSEA
jgi:hypothetical protein